MLRISFFVADDYWMLFAKFLVCTLGSLVILLMKLFGLAGLLILEPGVFVLKGRVSAAPQAS